MRKQSHIVKTVKEKAYYSRCSSLSEFPHHSLTSWDDFRLGERVISS